jgi:flavin-binding protein dodecin
MEHLKGAIKGMSREGLEAAFADAMKRAADGREINNLPYVEKQEALAKIISDEILERIAKA